MWAVYILYSPSRKKTYTGSTNNVRRRILQHNARQVQSTATGAPWTLLTIQYFPNEVAARARERYFKTASGRRLMKKLIDPIITTWAGSSTG